MENLRIELNKYGLEIDSLILDSKIHRCRHKGSKDKRGWYSGIMLKSGVYCTYGSWDDGKTYRYKPDKITNITKEEIDSIRLIATAEKRQKEELNKKAAEKVQDLISKIGAVEPNHPYIQKKKIKPHEALGFENKIILPIEDPKQQSICSYQEIYPDGSKKLLYGGKKQGCYILIDGDAKKGIAVCEGWATGCSINEATGILVYVAIDAGNLENIVKYVIDTYKDNKIYLCADNDHFKEKNVGLTTCRKIKEKYPKLELRYPFDIAGTDFNDLHCEKGLDAVKKNIFEEEVKVIEETEIENDNLSLVIPNSLLNIGGLLEIGLKACQESSETPFIIQYAFPSILSIVANSIAGKIQCQGKWPNFYNVKVGGTSTGKTDSDKFFKKALMYRGIEKFYGATDFASGQGLFRSLTENAQCLLVIDEISYIFKRFDKPDANTNSKIQALLECFSNTGMDISKSYGDSRNSFKVEKPCINIIGNATTTIFDDIRPEDFETGLIQRFDFWCYDGEIPFRGINDSCENEYLYKFVNWVYDLHNVEIKGSNSRTSLQKTLKIPYQVRLEKKCLELLEHFSRENIIASNDYKETSSVGIISRRYDDAIKNAMCHMAITRQPCEIFESMIEKDLIWGIELAKLKADWKITKLESKISYGDFHKDCNTFIEAIKLCMKYKRGTTGRALANRKKRIKQWTPRYFKDVITALSARKEIKIDDSKKSTRYLLLEKTT